MSSRRASIVCHSAENQIKYALIRLREDKDKKKSRAHNCHKPRTSRGRENIWRERGGGSGSSSSNSSSSRHATQLTSNLNEVIIKKVFLFAVGVAQDEEGERGGGRQLPAANEETSNSPNNELM